MKKLAKLEKNKIFWYLLIIIIAFFFLRLPSLIEPNWYGDEGVYQVIALALQDGRALYSEIWDNKPPFLYVTYALFSGDQFSVRLLSLIFGILATVVFFLLSQKLFKNHRASIVATTLFTLLFATPYLEGNIANAENFMLLFTITSGFLIYKTSENLFAKHTRLEFSLLNSQFSILIAGFLLGIAFLYKVVAVFDFSAFLLFLFFVSVKHESNLRKNLKKTLFHFLKYSKLFFLGFAAPIIITFLYFIFQGNVIAFVQGAFFGNVDYVEYENTLFGISQGLLIIKVLLLLLVTATIFKKRTFFSKAVLFIFLWFTFTLFSSFFSGRPYTHYLLMVLPAFCMLVGLLFTKKTRPIKTAIGVSIALVLVLAFTNFHLYGVSKTLHYYQNVLSFLKGQKDVDTYQAFFDPETPRDYELVSYINKHTLTTDQIFLWGDSPQIYALSKKLPPNKYTTAYHILEHDNAFSETQSAIDKVQPKYIITLSEAPPLPFHLPNYTGKFGIQGAAIYERTF